MSRRLLLRRIRVLGWWRVGGLRRRIALRWGLLRRTVPARLRLLALGWRLLWL